MSRAEFGISTSSPLTKIRRILQFAQELERELMELKNISAIQEEQYKRENLLLDKKLFSVSKNLGDEVQLNNALYKDIKMLEQRSKILSDKIDILKTEIEEKDKKILGLQRYKDTKRLAMKKWLEKRMKRLEEKFNFKWKIRKIRRIKE